MTVIAAMGLRSDLIKQAFKTKEINEDGFYQIYFYDIQGIKRIMYIDHFFPYIENNESLLPLSARPLEGELWLMILEKAFAKYEGGYNNLKGGSIIDELNWLTGAYCQELQTNSPLTWNNIKTACKKGHILCCKTNAGNGGESGDDINSYNIPGVGEFNGVRLLTLKNPWGEFEWKGDFCDGSESWTEELKEFFSYENAKKEDGVFFIKYEDFVKEFSSIIICYC